jgi:hypothetical protein
MLEKHGHKEACISFSERITNGAWKHIKNSLPQTGGCIKLIPQIHIYKEEMYLIWKI